MWLLYLGEVNVGARLVCALTCKCVADSLVVRVEATREQESLNVEVWRVLGVVYERLLESQQSEPYSYVDRRGHLLHTLINFKKFCL